MSEAEIQSRPDPLLRGSHFEAHPMKEDQRDGEYYLVALGTGDEPLNGHTFPAAVAEEMVRVADAAYRRGVEQGMEALRGGLETLIGDTLRITVLASTSPRTATVEKIWPGDEDAHDIPF